MQLGPYRLSCPWILAPMAGVSEMPFRVLARRLGAGAAPTELVSAKGLLYGQARSQRYLMHHPCEQPFWVQIFGGDVASMVQGAHRALERGAHMIDINMGCPVKKVTKNGAGSALLCDPHRAADIVKAIHRSTGAPVTVKIRAGWTQDTLNFIEMTHAVADAGCCAVAMHARTRAQGYSGQAHWPWIKTLVEHSPIPVMGNGDVMSAEDAHRMQALTGCQGVMVGRGALGNPWIFEQLAYPGAPKPTAEQRWALIYEHLQAHLDFVGDERVGIRRFRSHLIWYAHGLQNAAAFRQRVQGIEDLSELLEICEAFYARAPVADAMQPVEFVERLALG